MGNLIINVRAPHSLDGLFLRLLPLISNRENFLSLSVPLLLLHTTMGELNSHDLNLNRIQ
jgi:hypothetical protein